MGHAPTVAGPAPALIHLADPVNAAAPAGAGVWHDCALMTAWTE
jgi:hypothetical protein